MLPDYTTLKAEFDHLFIVFIGKRIDYHLGFLAETPKHIYHEGDGRYPTYRSGEIVYKEMDLASASIEVDTREITSMSFNEIMSHLDEVAQNLASQIKSGFIENLNEALSGTEQNVDARGQKLSPKIIIEVYKKIEMDFSTDGKMPNIAMLVPPTLEESARMAQKELYDTPEYRDELERIIQEKRMQFRAREASRRLVG